MSNGDIQVPQSGNGASNGLLGILAPLMAGILGGQNMKRDREEHVQDRAEQQKENTLKDASQDLNNQTTAQALADAKLKGSIDRTAATVGRGNTALGAVFANPAIANDPHVIASVKEANDAQGLPTPMNPDGTLNVDAVRKPVTELANDANGRAQLQYIQSLEPAQRKPLLDALKRQGYDVPKDMYTNKEVVSAKDQAKFQQVKGLIGHYADEKQYQDARNQIRSKYYDDLGQLLPGKEALLAADTMKAQASASAIVTTANAAATRANAYAQRVQGEVTRWRQNPAGSTGTVRTLLSNSVSELGQLHTALNDAEKNLSTLAMTNPSEDDPTFMAAQQSVQQLQDQVKSATTADQELRNSLTGNPNVTAAAGAASGTKTTNVTPGQGGGVPSGYVATGSPAPSGAPEGAVNGPYIIHNGMVYKKAGS